MKFAIKYGVLALSLIGFADASYLTFKHYFSPVLVCGTGAFNDCGTVLKSSYSMMLGLPVALWGALHYLAVIYWWWGGTALQSRLHLRLLYFQTVVGVLFSAYYTYLQFFVIKALCPFCLASAVISVLLYFATRWSFYNEYRLFLLDKIHFFYQLSAKPLFFLLPADFVHSQAIFWGEQIGKSKILKNFLKKVFLFEEKSLSSKVADISFKNPIGLSAGYDYNASFTQTLPSIGFGFETIGTISSRPCEGNAKPRLGRLPKSKSLLVNKGFRNKGAVAIIKKLEKKIFEFPLGVSIGRTNDDKSTELKSAISDIELSFKLWEKSKVKHSFYELNISCPNLKKGADFYSKKNLEELLNALKKILIKKPVFVKMPIELEDKKTLDLLGVLSEFKFIKGVIFGNLQKNRLDDSFDALEIKQAGKGNFSGKPTFQRSNELIKLTYKKYSNRFIIIGCGGVFDAHDAYYKIKNGASLVQLITGLIFEGPQVVSKINQDLKELLRKDGYTNIKDAVGADIK